MELAVFDWAHNNRSKLKAHEVSTDEVERRCLAIRSWYMTKMLMASPDTCTTERRNETACWLLS